MIDQTAGIKVSVLLTGDELLAGDIVDSNSAFLSKGLSMIGLTPFERVTVPDDKKLIEEALIRLSSVSDLILMNGGLGSTVDDLTAEVISLVSGVPLEENPEAVSHIKKRFGGEYLSQNPKYAGQVIKQAMIPKGAVTIPNPVGLALGFKIKINRAICYVTPGVPTEMKAMFTETILPDIRTIYNLPAPLKQSRLFVTAVGESLVQYQIKRRVDPSIWDKVTLGFRAGYHAVEVKMSVQDQADERLLTDTENQVRSLFPENIFLYGDTLAEEVVRILSKERRWLSVAESCTGGRIASEITGVSGASRVFDRGIVSYSNIAKETSLNVSKTILDEFGAVSAEVAEEMVKGVIAISGSNYGLAVTGIAGPTGGTEEKPVGTVYIGWGNRDETYSRKFLIKRDRTNFQKTVAATSLDILRRFIQGYPTDAAYYYDELTRDRLRKAAIASL